MAQRLAEVLRPKPWRGDLIAAGALPLALGALLVSLRMEQWGVAPKLVVVGLVSALLLALGLLSEVEGTAPRPYQSLLLLTGLLLLPLALGRVADVLGAQASPVGAGKLFWVLAAGALAAGWVSLRRNSAVCALLAAVEAGASVIAFVSWTLHPHALQTFRWLVLGIAVVLALLSLTQRERRPRHAVQLLNAAGIAVLTLGLTLVAPLALEALGGRPAQAGGWRAVLFFAGAGLVAAGAVDREPGPAYLGAAVLASFVLLTAVQHGKPSLWFWPAFLILGGAILMVIGLRPSNAAPPEPGPRGDPAPPSQLPRR